MSDCINTKVPLVINVLFINDVYDSRANVFVSLLLIYYICIIYTNRDCLHYSMRMCILYAIIDIVQGKRNSLQLSMSKMKKGKHFNQQPVSLLLPLSPSPLSPSPPLPPISCTALHYSAGFNFLDFIEEFLEAGAVINIEDNRGTKQRQLHIHTHHILQSNLFTKDTISSFGTVYATCP